jgi:adenosylhomocysteinase
MATTTKLAGHVKDASLAAKGKLRIEWADQWMPVLQLIRKRFVE